MAKKHQKENDTAEQKISSESDQDTPSSTTAAETGAESSAEDIAPDELEEARTQAARNWDLYLRERAELENFRKRTQRDKEEAIRFANDRLLKELLPVLDNLERAVDHAGQNIDQHQGLLEGVTMTITLFNKVLVDFGVKPVPAVGTPFDPNLHQAMGQVETDEHPANTVVTEFQKGYLLNDRLLRPALVMVAKTPAKQTSDSPKPDDETNS